MLKLLNINIDNIKLLSTYLNISKDELKTEISLLLFRDTEYL